MERATQHRVRAFVRQLAKQNFSQPGKAMHTIAPQLTWGSARVAACRALTTDNALMAIKQEMSKIATPEEIDTFFTSVMHKDSEATPNRLRAGELLTRIQGRFIDRSINENHNVDETAEALERASQRALDSARDIVEST